LTSANDGQAHFLYGESVNANDSIIKAFHKGAAGAWDAGRSISSVRPVGDPGVVGFDGPVVRADDLGNVVAVWANATADINDRTATSNVFFSRRDALTGTWSPPQVLQSDPLASARYPRLVMQPNGMAWAVWIERTFKDRFFAANDLFAAFAARFDPASGWSAAEKVTGDLRWPLEAKITTEGQGNPRVIVASNGGAIGVLQSTLYAARRSPTGTWAALETLAVAGPAGGLVPEYSEFDMAVDADDNAVAMWREYDGTRYLILTRHYTLVGGWEPTLGLQPSGPDSGFAPQLAMD
jgi:hypothetical protein